ncbi:MAG TPA: arsinothricin resistance N-acetyltransferase ArsN1 family B [Roseiflexaceae bacterium]|nr:arsinothricin resistance N-acetyltransferase ArsN1 family B [Roseiflexaceae bacterium]
MPTSIRLATPADAAAIQAIYAPSVVNTPISFELEPPSVDEMAARIAATLTRHPWLVCEVDGAIAGYAYGSTHRTRMAYQWAADVSAYVHPDFRRRRVGQALYQALLELLRLQGFFVAYAGITQPNPASVRLHESVGFVALGVYRHVGYKLGAWHDVGWWQLDLRERTAEPLPPMPPGALRDTPPWNEALAAGAALVLPAR